MSAAPRPRGVARVRAALARRARGPYAAIDRIDGRLDALATHLQELRKELGRVSAEAQDLSRQTELLNDDLRLALRALAAEEPRNRRLLGELREADDYRLPWTEDEPLVTVTVATLGRPELTSRSLPSILAQTHQNLEVIVAGDEVPTETDSAVAELGDPRVRFLDLGARQSWTDDPVRHWLVGSTRARNAAVAEARGRWVVEFDDDDAMRPNCVEALLELARGTDAEAVYGQVRQHAGGDPIDFCTFPPRLGRFSWAAGMYHAGLHFFGRQLLAADLGLPGDWWLAERMLRAGVRFAMREEVLADAYASDRKQEALGRGRIPWSERDL
jgi:Glycosyl transferase family 2